MINVLVIVVFMKIQANYVNLVIIAVKHVLELNLISASLVAMIQQDHWLLLKKNKNVSVNRVILKKINNAWVLNI